MSRSRWIKRALAGVLALSGAGGCKQQLFMDPGDYHNELKIGLPKTLETNPHGPIVPDKPDNLGSNPTTVIDFVRPPRYMTLRECIALALEQGNVGVQTSQGASNGGAFGLKIDNLAALNGGTLVTGTDAIRAFALDPAIAQPEVERSLSRFDARWITSMQWQKIDAPTPAGFLSFQNSQDAAQLNSSLVKPLPTGGVAGITFSTTYSKYSAQAAAQSNLVNPNYIPTLTFGVEQPLLKLFGVEINEISNQIPLQNGSVLFPNQTSTSGSGTEGILITRIRVDQAKANFDAIVNYMLVNVEAAYWNLYAAYYNLYANEEGLRQAFEGYRFTYIRVINGNDPPQRLDQIQAQFHRFQRTTYQARAQVLESERQLRGLLGLRSDDGVRVVPIDEPNLAPYTPDFHEAANDAIALRPELLLCRQDVMYRSLFLRLQKNLRRPDLRSYASYNISGLGTRLGGSDTEINPATGALVPGNALSQFTDNRYNSWTLGLRLDVPIGFRDANGLVREAQLNLARSYVQLRDQELKAIEYLASQYRNLIASYIEIAPARAEREALQKYIARIKEVIRIGSWTSQFFLDYLTVQQQLATAIATESQAIANYNIALASFEFAKGTIQEYNRVSVGEGPLPPWVTQRAKDRFREKTEAAFKLRDQPAPPVGPSAGGESVGPAGGISSLPKLPPFAEKRDPLPDMLLPPQPLDKNAPPAPAPRPLGGGGAPMPNALPALPNVSGPLPGLNPGADGPVGAGDYFKPDSRVALPPPPDGTRSAAGNPLPPLTGAPGGPGDYFRQGGTATLPPPPGGAGAPSGGVPSSTGPGGTANGPSDFFRSEGPVNLPPPPRRPAEADWGPPGSVPSPGPLPPPATSPGQPLGVAPLPPIVPPPPATSGLPGGQ
jgi:outer membrane protein TolC